MLKVETRFLIKAGIKRTVTDEDVVKDEDEYENGQKCHHLYSIIVVIMVIIISVKLDTYETLRYSRVTILAVGEDVFTGGEEVTGKPKVSSLPSSSSLSKSMLSC